MDNAARAQEVATALWYVSRGRIELRDEPLDPPPAATARLTTLFSAVSRGTERLIYGGAVPETEWQRMRAPFQSGEFPFPVKYGYCAVGRIEEGPSELKGHAAFCLHPHQTRMNVPAASLVLVPEAVPVKRATLAANMETALNAIWDASAQPGDRIMVIGGGIVGLLIGYLAARIPGTEVTLADLIQSRRDVADGLGMRFVQPGSALDAEDREFDVVFHTSATEQGLQSAIDYAGNEARVIEVSWYGSKPVTLNLGGAFHSRRLALVSSQVGQVSPSRHARWPLQRRLKKAMALLDDPALDLLVQTEIPFQEAPRRLSELFEQGSTELPPVIRYDAA